MARLGYVDAQCAAAIARAPPNPDLVDENLRGYVLLLSAHFQGFCRDIYTECTQIVVSRVRGSLQLLVQEQFSAHRKLDRGNPNVQNLKIDFERFGFSLDLVAVDAANRVRLAHLGVLNEWRNVAAHHGIVLPNQALSLSVLQAWRSSCDGLAASLDAIMYTQLKRILRRKPWIP